MKRHNDNIKTAPSHKQALADLYYWATHCDRTGNPYRNPEVVNAGKLLNDLPDFSYRKVKRS